MIVTADVADTGKRVDRWLHEKLPEISRSRIKALIAAGQISIIENSSIKLSPHTSVTNGLQINVEIPSPDIVEVIPENIALDILYEDSDVIAVNKPAGMVVHPAPGHTGGTLVNALLFHCADLQGIGGELRPGIVHRLDKDTSGVILVAKNDMAMDNLTKQFKERVIKKEYRALVYGEINPDSGSIETVIGRSRHDRKKMSVSPAKGRDAISHYEVLERFGDSCYVSVRIETGRTHQIRVHMTHIGHPVIGDNVYCSEKRRKIFRFNVSRQMLHAYKLKFRHPENGEEIDITAPLKDDMLDLLDKLREK